MDNDSFSTELLAQELNIKDLKQTTTIATVDIKLVVCH